jgi:hypothetical protein
MTSQQFLVCDNSTAANFKGWAKPISDFIRACGWTNTTDTGQLNGAGPGNWSGVSTVPGSGASYYEVFQPGDGLHNFYMKIFYGNSPYNPSANSPTISILISEGMNGAGGATGNSTGQIYTHYGSYAPPGATNTYECNMSGDSGRLSFLLWRNAPGDAPAVFAIQRSLNASGSPTGTYVTLWTCGVNDSNGRPQGYQGSLYFGVGVAATFGSYQTAGANSTGWPTLNQANTSSVATMSFNGSIPVWFLQPCVGIWDYLCTVIGVGFWNDLVEGVPFTTTNQYGQTKTYIPTRVGRIPYASQAACQSGWSRPTTLVEFD